MLEYFTNKKGKAKATPPVLEPKIEEQARKKSLPVLSAEDEAFLHHIETNDEDTPPPLPARPQDLPIAGDHAANDRQIILADEASQVPLPDVPDTPQEFATTPTESKSKNRWSFLKFDGKSRDKKHAGDALSEAVADSRAGGVAVEPRNVTAGEASEEKAEIESVLEQLNLAAVNNTVFSISDETRELLRKFTLVFRDLVNGVPTAYHDLEALLTNSEDQIQKMWLGLPPFLQQLVSKLPTKFTAGLGPEVLAAAAAEKPSLKADLFSKGVDTAGKAGFKMKIPSLKDLVGKKGALISLFRTIMTTLRTRFPAIMGVNVLWSLGITLLLLVCWYCHKRGKEVRLEKERVVTEAEMEEIKKQVESDAPGEWVENMTTLAPEGASIEEIRASLAPAASASTPALTEYAEGGSLAQAMREDAAAKEAASKAGASGTSQQTTSTGEHA